MILISKAKEKDTFIISELIHLIILQIVLTRMRIVSIHIESQMVQNIQGKKYFGFKNLDVDFTYTGVCLFNMSLFAGTFKISGNLAFS